MRPVNSSTMMTSPSLIDILHIAAIKCVRFDRSIDVMLERPVFRIGNVADAEQLLDLQPAFVGDRNIAVLFIDHKIAGELRGLAGSHFQLFALFELGDDAVHTIVLVGRFLARAGNDQRRAGFVDQDGIDFIDDGKIVPALHTILEIELHVVAQVIEAELIVGAVGDICGVSGAALLIVEVVDNHAHGEAEKAIELAHPF